MHLLSMCFVHVLSMHKCSSLYVCFACLVYILSHVSSMAVSEHSNAHTHTVWLSFLGWQKSDCRSFCFLSPELLLISVTTSSIPSFSCRGCFFPNCCTSYLPLSYIKVRLWLRWVFSALSVVLHSPCSRSVSRNQRRLQTGFWFTSGNVRGWRTRRSRRCNGKLKMLHTHAHT